MPLRRGFAHLLTADTMDDMRSALSRVAVVVGAVAVVGPLALIHSAPAQASGPCPDIEVVFARGTSEGAAGLGFIGQGFSDAVKARVAPRSVGVYAVNYPASDDFQPSMAAGGSDAAGHIQAVANDCPGTKIVLGGYSQGAAVVDMASNTVPPAVEDHVAAAALFATPRTSTASRMARGPLPAANSLPQGKAIDICLPNDPICAEGGTDEGAHGPLSYIWAGTVDQAADFVAGRV